jgi:hypothetical protein
VSIFEEEEEAEEEEGGVSDEEEEEEEEEEMVKLGRKRSWLRHSSRWIASGTRAFLSASLPSSKGITSNNSSPLLCSLFQE